MAEAEKSTHTTSAHGELSNAPSNPYISPPLSTCKSLRHSANHRSASKHVRDRGGLEQCRSELMASPASPVSRRKRAFTKLNRMDTAHLRKRWSRQYEAFDYWIFYRIEELKQKLEHIERNQRYLDASLN